MSPHPSDEDLMRLAEGALPEGQARAVSDHLEACPDCHNRFTAYTANEALASDLCQAFQRQALHELPSDAGTVLDLPRPDPVDPQIRGYRILGRIDEGGQGVVYEAMQEATRRRVAIKTLLHGRWASGRDRDRFVKEIELVASLQHPNIVTIYESGLSKNLCYFAMEFVEGLPLNKYVALHDLNTRPIIEIMEKVAAAMAYAHDRGVIHRDLKPHNILVDAGGEPRLLDFGLARLLPPTREDGTSDADETGTVHIKGTLEYMSPEQAGGQSNLVGAWSDVYSLGVIMYRLLTGQPPYVLQGATPESLRRIQEQEPPLPSKIAPHLDTDLETIVMKALAKDPAHRYQSADNLHQDLRCWLDGSPIAARSASSLYVLRKLVSKHRYAGITAALVAVILLSAGVVSTSFYLESQGALARAEESDEAVLAANQAREQFVHLATHQRTVGWILLSWHQDRPDEAMALLQVLPKDSPERLACVFLLDVQPLDQKADDLRRQLGPDRAFLAEYFIGEHGLHDGDVNGAVEAFQRSLDLNDRGWFAERARHRLQTLQKQQRPIAAIHRKGARP